MSTFSKLANMSDIPLALLLQLGIGGRIILTTGAMLIDCMFFVEDWWWDDIICYEILSVLRRGKYLFWIAKPW